MMLTIAAVLVVVMAVILLFPGKKNAGQELGKAIDSARARIFSTYRQIEEEAEVAAEEFRRLAQERWKEQVRQKAAETLGAQSQSGNQQQQHSGQPPQPVMPTAPVPPGAPKAS